MTVLASFAALAGLGLLAATGLGGDGSAEPATAFATSYAEVRATGALEPALVPPTAGVAGRHSDVSVSHLVTERSFTVEGSTPTESGSFLLRVKCPKELEPITGGTLSLPGIAISNSSRQNPEPDQKTRERSWYIGVTNLTTEPLQFKGTLVCADGI